MYRLEELEILYPFSLIFSNLMYELIGLKCAIDRLRAVIFTLT